LNAYPRSGRQQTAKFIAAKEYTLQTFDLDTWTQKATDLLTSNRIEIDGYRYTAPSLDIADFGRKDYANQFMLDSCFHAIAWARIDPIMAQDELLSLVSRQVTDGPDAGMIPHCNYWRGGASWLWGQDDRSSITELPLIATAAWLVHQFHDSRAFLESIYTPMRAYHDWFDRRRDFDGDGLVSLIHPWEAGGDALPRWDKLMKLDSFSHEAGRDARLDLAQQITKYDADGRVLADAGWFSVESMDYNAVRVADMEAMGKIAEALGKSDDVEMWQRHIDTVRRAFQAKMIIDERPYDLAGVDEHPILQDSAGQFTTLFGGMLTQAQADGLVSGLRDPRFWTPFPITTSPTDAPTFDPEIYWRGNVWPCINWLIFQGLRRYGYDDLANGLAERGMALLEQSGFWEFYHPMTGEGLGGQQFSWATLLVTMAASANH
jgi:glycogen debranching enzyme